MTDDTTGERKVEVKRTQNGISGSIYKHLGHGMWKLVETTRWTDDRLAEEGPVTLGESVELKRTGEGVSVSAYAHTEDRSRLIDEGYWTNAELDGTDADTMLFTQELTT